MPKTPDFLHFMQSVGMREAGAAGQGEGRVNHSEVMCDAGHSCSSTAESAAASAPLAVRWHRMQGMLKHAGDGERIFRALYGQSRGEHTFWLDR